MNSAITSQDKSLKPISVLVIIVHLLLIAWLFAFSAEIRIQNQPKRLTVSTIKLKPKAPSTPASNPASQPTIQKQEAPKPKEVAAPPPQILPKPKKAEPKPVEKKATPKPAPQKKPAPQPKKEIPKAKQPKPPPQPKADPMKEKQIALLSQAKEKIDRVNTTSDKVIAKAVLPANLPSKIESLSIESLKIETAPSMGVHEIAYRDELAQRLKLLLKMPEYGTVKVKLTLNRLGKVVKVQIVSAESQANKSHIEKTLPKLTFPPFGAQFEGAEEFTFNITMSNDV